MMRPYEFWPASLQTEIQLGQHMLDAGHIFQAYAESVQPRTQ